MPAHGLNPQTMHPVTNSAGQATIAYTSASTGSDTVQAMATISGLYLVSNQAAVTWTPPAQVPLITQLDGDRVLQLPNRAQYTATVVDPVAPRGGAIAPLWTQVSGPGTVI